VAALAGALAAALAAMVANLPHPKSAYEGVRAELEEVAVRAQEFKQRLIDAIDEDTWAFQQLLEASRSGDVDRQRQATLLAAEVPLGVAEACPEIADLCRRARRLGMPASASDAGVGAGMVRAAAAGAVMNVYINLQEMGDDPEARDLLRRADAALDATRGIADELEDEVWRALGRDSGGVKTS
jgi:glutamate formiminotransferase/formiminotetrahydrofolate cyclodeaminase